MKEFETIDEGVEASFTEGITSFQVGGKVYYVEDTDEVDETLPVYQVGGSIPFIVPMSMYGLYEYPQQPVVVPSNRITMDGINKEVLAVPDNDPPIVMQPNQEYSFPNSTEVLEVPSFGKGGLKQWFAEEWKDIKTGKPCGRSKGEARGYPACRPSKRVNASTPKTSGEMSSQEKARFKRTKTSKKRIPYNHKKGGNIPKNKELYARVKAEAKRKFDSWPSAYGSAWLVRTYKARGGKYEEGGVVFDATPDETIYEPIMDTEFTLNPYTPVAQPVTAPKGGTIAVSHNNPGNIKFGDYAQQYGAVEGRHATDGGTFAVFPDVNTGLKAQRDLLLGKNYRNLTVDEAMKRWSNRGYGGEIYPDIANKVMLDLSEGQLKELQRRQIRREDIDMYNLIYNA